ncbi:hypothetical protein EYF80_054369 [Liparis tanakae]|uniref:Uncharacterized protein n=1 Tax=Liparis tanakae TaxID=230148 RepID=A0A4Z2F462_9TELE|nr:hypothetical protein EYF80_054369 [Liparis tanakae]
MDPLAKERRLGVRTLTPSNKEVIVGMSLMVRQTGVPARVPRRGPPDQQLGGGLVYLGHLLFVGDVFAVLQPQDVSLSSGWEDREETRRRKRRRRGRGDTEEEETQRKRKRRGRGDTEEEETQRKRKRRGRGDTEEEETQRKRRRKVRDVEEEETQRKSGSWMLLGLKVVQVAPKMSFLIKKRKKQRAQNLQKDEKFFLQLVFTWRDELRGRVRDVLLRVASQVASSGSYRSYWPTASKPLPPPSRETLAGSTPPAGRPIGRESPRGPAYQRVRYTGPLRGGHDADEEECDALLYFL